MEWKEEQRLRDEKMAQLEAMPDQEESFLDKEAASDLGRSPLELTLVKTLQV